MDFSIYIMKKGYGNFLRTLKALKWHGLYLSCREAAYIRPLSKKFAVQLIPKANHKAHPQSTSYGRIEGYWLKTSVGVKTWMVENYLKFSPLSPEISATRLERIKAILEDGLFISERLVFSE